VGSAEQEGFILNSRVGEEGEGDGGKVFQLIGSLQQEIRPSLVKITVVGFNCNQPPAIPIWMPLQPIKKLEAGLAHAVNFPLNPIPLSRQIEQVRQTAKQKRKRIRRASLRNKLRQIWRMSQWLWKPRLSVPYTKTSWCFEGEGFIYRGF
jgi:hypothetical protein